MHLISLLPSLKGLIVPSKFYGIIAAKRPMIFVGAQQGELAQEIKTNQLGYCVGAGDVQLFCDCVLTMYKSYQKSGSDGFNKLFDYADTCVDMKPGAWREIFFATDPALIQ